MYCSIQDIEDDMTRKTLVEASNDVDASDTVNNKLVTSKILEVSNKIDSYLNSSYTVPVTDTNALNILKPICVSLVVCDLYQRRFGLDYPPSLDDRRKLAIKDLEKIQKGIILLIKPVIESTTSNFKVSKRTKIFTNDLLRDY